MCANAKHAAEFEIFKQCEDEGLMNRSHWSSQSDQLFKPYLDLLTLLVIFAMHSTFFVGSVYVTNTNEPQHKKIYVYK